MKTRTTVVVGLGNPVRGDDAVGLRVAAAIERLLARHPVPGVRVATSTRGGFELIDLLAGADRAVVVDCLESTSPRPGLARLLPAAGVAGSARLVGSHDIGLAAALDLGRVVGIGMPGEVEVVGIEAETRDAIEEGLSPEVAAAVPRVAKWIFRRLGGTVVGPNRQSGSQCQSQSTVGPNRQPGSQCQSQSTGSDWDLDWYPSRDPD